MQASADGERGGLGARAPRRIELSTLAVLAALVAVGLAWLVWARLTAVPGGGLAWSALDSILAANADRQTAQAAPPFQLSDPYGRSFALDDLHGQVVLINFWATWCVPCRAEMPELDSLAREYADRGFRVLAVNVLEDTPAARRSREELGREMPLRRDPDGERYQAYRVLGLPLPVLVGPDGVSRYVRLGVVTRAYLEARLPALLAGRAAS